MGDLRSEYRLLALDLRGHGDSFWTDAYCMADYAADVLSVVDQLNLAPCHLVGMSLGGATAGRAARLGPERFASLSLVDVAPGVDFESTSRMRAFVGGVADAPSVEAVAADALAVSPKSHPGRLAYRMEALLTPSEGGGVRWKQDRRRPTDFPDILAEVARLDASAAASGLPTLLVRGGRSRVLGCEATQAFAAAVPGAKISIAPDAGHNVQEDNPAHLARALRDFWT